VAATFHLRPYRSEDEDAAIALWQHSWQQAYPSIDFAARAPWWRERWRNELVPNAAIIVAEQADALIGFVTIDLKGYLDQLVVGPPIGARSSAMRCSTRPSACHQIGSRYWSTPTMPAPSGSMSATVLCRPAPM
jgi:hypothetical protein